MSFEEEFDKIIRQKSEEAEFPFSEKNWERASSMIDSDRKATRLLRYSKLKKPLIAISIGLIGLVALVYYSGNIANTESVVAENKNTKNIKRDSKQSVPFVEAEVIETTQAEANGKLNAKSKEFSKLATRASEITIPKQAVSKTIRTENIIPVSEATSEIKSSNTANAAEFEAEKASENGSESALSESTELASNAETSDTKHFELSQRNETPIVSIASETKHTQIHSTDNLNGKNESVEMSSNETLSADYLAAKILQLNPTTKEQTIEQLAVITKFDTDYFKQKRKTHFLNLELGTAYLSGWNTNDGVDAKGFNCFGGINYGMYLNNNLNVSIGLQGYAISHMSQPFYESSHKDYDFGSTTIYTVVTCGQMFYAALPLKINYQLNTKSQIGLGVNMAYLFNTSTKTESYYYQDNSKISTGTTHSNDVFESMNQYNCMLTASYQRRLGKRFGIGAEIIYGVSDLFEKSVQTSLKENTVGLRLALQYTIFDK